MGGVARTRNITAYLDPRYMDFVSITAGGSNDSSEVSGPWIDALDFDTLCVTIAFETTLQANETLKIKANLQDADDSSGTNSADYGTALSNTTFATGASGGSTETGQAVLEFDLSGAKRYVRIQLTGDLSASSTDTADLMAIGIFAGKDELETGVADN